MFISALRKNILIFSVLGLVLAEVITNQATAKHIVLSFYQKSIPFETSEGKGLFYDLIDYFSANDPNNTYELRHIPRARINRQIETNLLEFGVVGANPAWFNDVEQKKYYWTRAILTDKNEIISSLERKFEYRGPQSMIGLTLGGIRGHYYVNIDPLVKAGSIVRKDVNNVETNIKLTIFNRVDISIVNKFHLDLYIKNTGQRKFHISKEPHTVHDKSILIPLSQKYEYQQIDKLLTQARKDGSLEKIIGKYQDRRTTTLERKSAKEPVNGL
ncbi:hypothetical protein L4C34_03115 [Vibrio profundum]|uniref:hypothetical protein n=1 Tax=Vibrio profundum TaxID=2910247 RepID=UPI003D0E5877